MAEDWDLYAVVRSYANAGAANSTTSFTTDTTNPVIGPAVENPNQELGGSSSFTNLADPFLNAHNPSDFPGFAPHPEGSFQGLEEIYKEQYENLEPYAVNAATSLPHQYDPSISVVQDFHKQQQYTPQPEQLSLYPQHSQHMIQPHHHHQQHLHAILGSSPLSFPSTSPQPIRSRRRKNQQAKMIHRMTQEELSADSWAWRKYGQKPIKGSPYPRNYYRCSTSKGCIARRQVERCPTDPNMYVVSYSGQHSHPRPTHRSSLAGSTRTKTAAKPSTSISSEPVINTAPTNTSMASSSSPTSGSSFSPRGESAAEEGADAENPNSEIMLGEEEEEGEGWDEEEEEDDDDDDNNGDGEILIPNSFIDHY